MCIRDRFETVRNDAVESTVCHHTGSQIARLVHSVRAPGFGVRMERARRAICEPLWRQTAIRPHHSARFQKLCIIMRSYRPYAATAARTSHARARHANTCSHETRARAICEPPRRQTVASTASLRTVFETVRNDAVEST
eukprot:5089771-Lingulodinium_polyedra.AAC.1